MLISCMDFPAVEPPAPPTSTRRWQWPRREARDHGDGVLLLLELYRERERVLLSRGHISSVESAASVLDERHGLTTVRSGDMVHQLEYTRNNNMTRSYLAFI